MEHAAGLVRNLFGLDGRSFPAWPRALICDTSWKRGQHVAVVQDACGKLNEVFDPAVLETIVWLQQRNQSPTVGGGLSSLPISVVRAICQLLSHADIEQCRLVCKDWRTSFGEASVTDCYLAMCADLDRASDLTTRFAQAYPNFHHLHFWIPGGPVRQMMGTDGSTFSKYMELFAACSVRVLTAHYLDDHICPVQGITQLSTLTKLELVDLMPANASLACLASLPHLRHLIVEYKDSSAAPDFQSIGDLHNLTHLELALHSTFTSNAVVMALPWQSSRSLGVQERVSSILSSIEGCVWMDGAEHQAKLEAILRAIIDSSEPDSSPEPDPVALVAEVGYDTAVVSASTSLGMSADEEDAASEHEAAETPMATPSTSEDGPCVGSEEASAVQAAAAVVEAAVFATIDMGASQREASSWSYPAACCSPATGVHEYGMQCAALSDVAERNHAQDADPPFQDSSPLFGPKDAAAYSNQEAAFAGTEGVQTSRQDPELEEKTLTAAAAQGVNAQAKAAEASEDALPVATMYHACTASTSAVHKMECRSQDYESKGLLEDQPCPESDGTWHPVLQAILKEMVDELAEEESEQQACKAMEADTRGSQGGSDDPTVADVQQSASAQQSSVADVQQSSEQTLQVLEHPATVSAAGATVVHQQGNVDSSAVSDVGPGVGDPMPTSQPPNPFPNFQFDAKSDNTMAVSASDYLLAHMLAHWTGLRNLQRLEIRSMPVELARCHPLLFRCLPSMTELKLVGPDARLKVYGPSQPAFKVEVSRDSSSLALGPASLALSLHCDTASDTSAALQQLAVIALSVAPTAGGAASEAKVPAPAAPMPAAASRAGVAPAVMAAGSSTRHQAWVPWISPHIGPPVAAASTATMLSPVAAAAASAAEEKRRQQLLQQHPALGVLQTHTAKVTTLRLYLENPDFTSLKPLAQLSHIQELYIALCYTSGSDSESEDDMQMPQLVMDSDQEDYNIAAEVVQTSASVAPAWGHLSVSAEVAATAQSEAAAGEAAAGEDLLPLEEQEEAEGVAIFTGTMINHTDAPLSASVDAAELLEVPAGDETDTEESVSASIAAPGLASVAPLSTLQLGSAEGAEGQINQADTNAPDTSVYADALGADAEADDADGSVLDADADAPTSAVATAVPSSSVADAAAAAAAAPAPVMPTHAAGPEQAVPSRSSQTVWGASELSSRHIISVLRGLPHLTSLTVREEIPTSDDSSPCSHEQCALGPGSCEALVRSLKHLVHLEWQGLLVSPHPSSLKALSSLASLRSLTLVVNPDDPMARLGLHCLPESLTSLTLQNISVAPAPRGQSHQLPVLCHLHLKSCSVPDVSAFVVAPTLEWLSLDNCDTAVYVADLADLWPSLSWLEITYTHQDWRLLHSPRDLPALGSLTRLRKLSLVTPYEDALTTEALLALTQLRLLSISPSPLMNYEQFMRLAELRFLAGLEVKLYSDVLHHEELVDMAGSMHADLQEGLPMTDVLIMVDDSYADEPS